KLAWQLTVNHAVDLEGNGK
ncbi:hypothetical protein MJO28_010374, partial [Puccinia striiformis f. sp. tritici]